MIEFLREEERQDERRREEDRKRTAEGGRLAGSILVVVGGVLTFALYRIVPSVPVYLIGLAPLGIGLVFFVTPLFARRG